jgi:cytolysin (calcineurin-like family phosphatase)
MRRTIRILSVLAVAAVVLLLSALAGRSLLQRQDPPYDVTFFVASDTHYGLSATVAGANRQAIDAMNVLPGTTWPESIGAEVVAEPRGLVLVGDLLEAGGSETAPASWSEFVADFGVAGEGRLRFPVYEGVGNHDGGAEHVARRGVRQRNRLRPGVTGISENGLHYSWNWSGVHFVHLNLFGGSAGDDIINPWGRKFEGSWKYPEHSLEFVAADLERNVGDSGRPVVIFQHYGWDEWGLGWWSEAERDALYRAIKPYNVAAIFWGHTHNIQRIDWRGIPTFCVGSPQRDPDPGSFVVVRLTPGHMDVAERRIDSWGEVWRIAAER